MRYDQARKILHWLAVWWSACIGTAVALSFCTLPQPVHAQLAPDRKLPSQAQQIPRAALQHRQALKREAQRVWGLNAPVATLAAQIHQESRWRADARSPVGALGLAQFMPTTATWIGGLDGGLAARTPLNPTWSIRALVVYDDWLWDRLQGDTPCDRMAFALSAYNGGLGWVIRRKQRSAQPGRCIGATCAINPGITPQAQAENEGYPRVILQRYEPLYASWGPGVCAS